MAIGKHQCKCEACGLIFNHIRKRRFCGHKCANRYSMKKLYGDLAHAFWSRVDKTESCWEWTGWTNNKGYGAIRGELAHRISFAMKNPDVPLTPDQCVCHKCDNPKCVNPDHLFVASQAENMQDMWRKGRGLRGETTPWSKFKTDQVLSIRKRRSEGESMSSMAKEYGVPIQTISAIVHRYSWQHV